MAEIRNVGVAGTGSYVPARILSNLDLEEMVDTSDEWITTRTGIKERRIAAEGEACSDLAVEAVRCALDDAKTSPEELDLLIVQGNRRLGFEFKRTSAPRLTRSMRNAMQALKLDELVVVHAGRDAFAMEKRVRAVPLRDL